MRKGKKMFHTSTYIDVEVDIESYDILELLEEELDAKEYELIENAIKGKSLSKCVESVSVDIDLDFDDLLEIVDNCTPFQLEMISDIVHSEDQIKVDTLYDEQKLKVIKIAFDKYSLEELQEKLK